MFVLFVVICYSSNGKFLGDAPEVVQGKVSDNM